MLNQVKRCYNYLDLPYNATIEDVQTRQKVMIKLIRAKGLKTGKLNEKKIKKINIAADKIVFYINKFGVAKKGFKFETDVNSTVNLLFAFLLSFVMFVTCLFAIL